MTPVYDRDGITLYHGDCMDVLSTLSGVDAVITSPPYNIGDIHHRNGRKHRPYDDAMPEGEYQAQQIAVLSALHRLAGNCFYNHKNRIVDGEQISPLSWLSKTPWIIKQECVWVNGGPNHDPCRFYPKTERLYWLAKRKESRLDNRKHWDFFQWNAVSVRLDGKGHTRAFPLALPKTIMEVLPNAQVFLDPYAGSGTTGIAALKMGRRCILVEKEARYIDVIIRRLEAAETPLFRPRKPLPSADPTLDAAPAREPLPGQAEMFP